MNEQQVLAAAKRHGVKRSTKLDSGSPKMVLRKMRAIQKWTEESSADPEGAYSQYGAQFRDLKQFIDWVRDAQNVYRRNPNIMRGLNFLVASLGSAKRSITQQNYDRFKTTVANAKRYSHLVVAAISLEVEG